MRGLSCGVGNYAWAVLRCGKVEGGGEESEDRFYVYTIIPLDTVYKLFGPFERLLFHRLIITARYKSGLYKLWFN